MIIYTDYKQQTLGLFPLVSARAQVLKQPEVVKRLDDARTHLVNGKLLVVVCGEFKRGKSKLVNALLEAPDLCPVDIDITTAIVTTIAWNEKEQITVVLGEPGHERVKEITREEIADYVTEQGNPRNRQQVQRLHILGPFASLKDGLVLVDTPGIGGLNTEHGAMTYAVLPEADVAIFVTDALKPLTAPELTFVRDWIARYCQHIIFVVTKIDARPDYQTSVEDARQKLTATLDHPSDTLTIVPVSSRLKLESLASGDTYDLTESNFSALEEALWNGLGAQAIPLLLTNALSALSQAVTDLRSPLEAERDVYQEAATQRKVEITATRERLKALQSKTAHWSRELNEGLSDAEKMLRRTAEDVFRELLGQVDDDLQDPKLVRKPEKIVDQITPRIVALSLDLRESLKTQVTDLQDKLKATTGLTLSGADNLTPPTFPEPTLKLPKPRRRSFWRKAWDVVLAVWDVAVGLVLFWQLPRAITRLADALKTTLQRETLSPAQIKARLQQFLSESQTAIRRSLEDMITELRRSMSRELEEQIQQDIERCNEMLKRMVEADRVPSDKIGQSLVRVEQELNQLGELQRRVNELASLVVASTTPPPQKSDGQLPTAEKWGSFADE